ncbi:HigA family addiction module antidote protein [Laribacter hongkongensis]|uniref:HigA family addiction module antidote protein n=2 Tax=Laribacter hongkongensis TaxID=168471 RepID=A0ABD4SUU1_9NEIS|nr:HigA family addiction module antidote protein [Laribacter hongkongensis]MCG9104329.1 HigA family addiction module antidote protein [Laribacter hongkongensis]MCG9114134.1 HigA family addiction module antidote protein [Laribacter hongkongensis]
MFNPPHPGETLREDIFPGLGLTVTEAAKQLGVSRVALSRVANGKAAISPDMALRLEAWLGGPSTGPSAESWLRQQASYDLWQLEQQGAPKIAPAVPTCSNNTPHSRG